MREAWVVDDFIVEIEPATQEGIVGFHWRVNDRSDNYRSGGWEPNEASALKACLSRLEELFRPAFWPEQKS